jgi:signal transduction histidine kinase
MVAQLLDLSRLESGASPLHVAPVELRAILEQAAVETRLHHPGADISVAVEPDGLELDADGERLHQVVANLLENAARYSPTGSPVTVDAGADERRVVINVRDRGPGIPTSEQARIFERFYRTDAARRHDNDGVGAGLGLAIARWIVELHGGQIRVGNDQPAALKNNSAADREGPDERSNPGCVMTVELPRKALL